MGEKYICNHPGMFQPKCAGCYEMSYGIIYPKEVIMKNIDKMVKQGKLFGKLRH